MFNNLIVMTLLSGFVGASAALANSIYYEKDYHDVHSVEVYDISLEKLGASPVLISKETLPNSKTAALDLPIQSVSSSSSVKESGKDSISLGQILVVTKEMIALGKEVYKIVEAGKPVIDVEDFEPISVLPRLEGNTPADAFSLTDWRSPVSNKYRVVMRNRMGMTPVMLEFMLIFAYGGQLDGKGRYLTGAHIRPTRVEVAWGYSFDASFKLESVVNQGSQDFPIAGALLSLDYTVKTLVKESQFSKLYYINGAGEAKAH